MSPAPSTATREGLAPRARTRVASMAFAAAGLVLLATATLHASGFPMMREMLGSSGVPTIWAAGIRLLWIDFSIHLVIVAAIYLVASLWTEAIGLAALALATLLPTADLILLYTHVGVFPGSLLLTLAVLLAWSGVGTLMRRWSV